MGVLSNEDILMTISEALYSDRTDEWPTPRSLFGKLNAEFKFTLDPCASARSLKLELPGKLPSLHDPPPAPSKHLTRCLRNRVQAKEESFLDARYEGEIEEQAIVK